MDFKEINEEIREAIIDKMASLYLFNKTEYLEQKEEGYATHTIGKPSFEEIQDITGKKVSLPRFPRPLNRDSILLHLIGDKTYGVKAGEQYAKFITFDIDCNESKLYSLETARALVDTLITLFEVPHDAIHVIFSGKKGYHVTIYFEKPISRKVLKTFHTTVIQYMDYPSEVKIELRPTGQGVKMPLGIHRTAPGKPRSWFVDKHTFKPIEDFRYVLSIETVKDTSFLETLKELKPAKNAPTRSKEYFSLTDKEKADLQGFAAALIQNKKLTESHTRHTAAFALALYCHTLGHPQSYAINLIMEILHNSEAHYIELPQCKWLEETERVVNLCYQKGYKFKSKEKMSVRITKPELDKVMQLNGFKLKYFAFIMLVYGKMYGPLFYFPFSVAEKITGLNSRYTIAHYRDILINAGLIDWTNRGSIDIEASTAQGHRMFEKAMYQLIPIAYDEFNTFIDISFDASLETFKTVVKRFYGLNEIRSTVSKHEFYSYWRAA